MTILTVGSGQQFATLAAAIGASHDGDTIYAAAGTYVNDFATISTKIGIVGVGGMVSLVATQSPGNGKAILVTQTDVTLDHIEFSGATVPDANGAGIRYEGGNLTVTNSYFHDNQDGILAASNPAGTVTIDHSEFARNGVGGSGGTHNIYINEVGRFQITNSYVHDANIGHELKSRADVTVITNDRIFDNQSTASYSVDTPNGGAVTIQNNIIEQGPNSQNPAVIAYSAELAPYTNSQLTVANNTILNDKAGSAIAVNNFSSLTVQITGNQFYGLTSGQIASGPNAQSGNSFLSSEPALDTSHPYAASPWDDLISGTSGADRLNGTSGRDLFVGGAGNDVFVIKAGGGSDTIADFLPGAGAGDVAQLTGYALGTFAAVQAAMTQSGADALLNLGNGEILTFKNTQTGSFAADDFTFSGTTAGGGGGTGTGTGVPSTPAAMDMTALYSAAFDRAPDTGGLNYWEGVFNSGVSLSAISATFAGSAEFQGRYGNLDTSGFVTQLYQNVLHRTPDTGGFNYWSDAMQHGVSRGDVLMDFAVSPENIAKLSAAGWIIG